jgi:hypothetical protein
MFKQSNKRCKWFSLCPLRRLEAQQKIDGKWRENYCAHPENWRHCKRYQMEEKGVYHPNTLMPDGSSLSHSL